MRHRYISSAFLATALLSGPSAAHHGDAGRFQDVVTTLTGTVVVAQLVNPHSIVIFDVESEGGDVVRWQAEMGGPGRLAADFGWNQKTLSPGTEVRITGRVVKTGAAFINLTERARIVLMATCEEIYHSRSSPEDELSCD